MSRGKERLDMSSIGKAVSKYNLLATKGSGEAPPCRPWDRDDLFTRMSTFKSMTWFAKPQVPYITAPSYYDCDMNFLI